MLIKMENIFALLTIITPAIGARNAQIAPFSGLNQQL